MQTNREWERYNLGYQKGQQKSGSVKSQRRSVGRSHVNDRVDTVDIEEER